MKIGIDIDETITYAPEFFSFLTNLFVGHAIYIISAQDDQKEAEEILEQYNIRYHKLILVNDPDLGKRDSQEIHEWKAELIGMLKLDVFFDDSPEVIRGIQHPTKAFFMCDPVMIDWVTKCLSRDGKCRECETYQRDFE